MMPDSDLVATERVRLLRTLRHRLESLARAGVDRIPRPPAIPFTSLKARPAVVATAPAIVEPAAAPAAALAPERPRPAPAPPLVVAAPPTPALVASLFDEPGEAEPTIPAAERPQVLAALAAEVAACTRCPLLVPGRTQTVFGEGSPTARLMFVGEAPGETEDRTGRPFVGKAGVLLTDMITKGMGLTREDVYIANILKSRPPNNRDPLPDEVRNCFPFLERQIAIIRPEYLCILGKPAAQALLQTALPLGRLRGKWHRVRGIPAIVTYHPAYLLRNPAGKKEAWEDLQTLMRAMGIQPPGRKRG